MDHEGRIHTIGGALVVGKMSVPSPQRFFVYDKILATRGLPREPGAETVWIRDKGKIDGVV